MKLKWHIVIKKTKVDLSSLPWYQGRLFLNDAEVWTSLPCGLKSAAKKECIKKIEEVELSRCKGK